MRQESRQRHKDMLRKVKPTVDNGLPSSMYHPIVKAKKEQMIEGNQPTNHSSKHSLPNHAIKINNYQFVPDEARRFYSVYQIN